MSYQYPFGSFMQQCELNFSLLLRLMPEHDETDSYEYQLEDSSILQIEVVERHRYTIFIRLFHFYSDSREGMLDFELSIRLYLDAGQAEVFDQRGRAIEAKIRYPNPDMVQPDEKYNINHFLGDLLIHCSKYGRSTEAIF